MPTPHQLHSRPATCPEERDVHRVEKTVTCGGQHPIETFHPRWAARKGEDEEEEEESSYQTSSPKCDEGVIDEGGGQLDSTDQHDGTHIHT